MQVGSPDEIAYEQGWITRPDLAKRAEVFRKSDYGRNLKRLIND
jgi:glucose-1-phosphate thymidylyltransferase